MNNIIYSEIIIDGQSFGVPLNAIQSIESSDKAVLNNTQALNKQYTISFLQSDYLIKDLIANEKTDARELILILNSESQIALFVDSFQSIELNEDLIYDLPHIMRSTTSFISKVYFNPLTRKQIYLCEEESFYEYVEGRL